MCGHSVTGKKRFRLFQKLPCASSFYHTVCHTSLSRRTACLAQQMRQSNGEGRSADRGTERCKNISAADPLRSRRCSMLMLLTMAPSLDITLLGSVRSVCAKAALNRPTALSASPLSLGEKGADNSWCMPRLEHQSPMAEFAAENWGPPSDVKK